MTADRTRRNEVFAFGIASIGLESIHRDIPLDEPPPLPPNCDLSVIGKPIPRLNGLEKVTGAARFTTDIALPGQLTGRLLRSPHPHARIRSLDLSRALCSPGVRAAMAVGGHTVRYVGEPVAAVAAISMAAAEAALLLIQVDYEPLPFVVDLDRAREPGSPNVYDSASAPAGHASGFPARASLPLNGNVRGPAVDRRGDLAEGFAAADVLVEGSYRTQVQTHCCLEPHAVVAYWKDEAVTVYMSTQFTAGVRAEIAQEFGVPPERVRVIVDAMGGGFGSKSSLGTYGRVAIALSRQAGAPVRIAFTRKEEQIDSGNRPSTVQNIRLGAKREGTLTAIKVESFGSSGIGLGAGIGNIAQALYTCPNFESAQSDVFMNAGPGCAMRAPGNAPGAFGLEQAIDELAEMLGLDPVLLRDRIDPSAVRREERRIGAMRIGWEGRKPPGADAGPVKRGVGVAQSLWGANVQLTSACEIRIGRDGSVEARSGAQDIGTGTGTVIAQTVAEVLGLRPEDIRLCLGDTIWPPGGPSYGSRMTASITPPARTAAWRALQRLFQMASTALRMPASELVARNGRIEKHDDPTHGLGFRQAAGLMHQDFISEIASRAEDYSGFKRHMGEAGLARQDLGGVQFASVAVDTRTGRVRVERVVAVQDCGRPINPLLIESQVQGGVLMGLSYALLEDRLIDSLTGRMVNADLEHYKIAGSCDTPDIDVVLLENYQAQSATDAYGIAEPSNIATAPAIANAIYNAVGVRFRALPITPDVVLAALNEASRVGAG